jgi:hypothetical protein
MFYINTTKKKICNLNVLFIPNENTFLTYDVKIKEKKILVLV